MSNPSAAILRQANNEDPGTCTICYEQYTKDNRVMKYTVCGHIICESCVNNFGDNRCQECAATGGTYRLNADLTQSAVQQAASKVEKKTVTMSIVDMKGSTHQVTMLPSNTIKDVMDKLSEQSVNVSAVSHKNKVYQAGSNVSLEQAGIRDNSRLVSVARFEGGK